MPITNSLPAPAVSETAGAGETPTFHELNPETRPDFVYVVVWLQHNDETGEDYLIDISGVYATRTAAEHGMYNRPTLPYGHLEIEERELER